MVKVDIITKQLMKERQIIFVIIVNNRSNKDDKQQMKFKTNDGSSRTGKQIWIDTDDEEEVLDLLEAIDTVGRNAKTSKCNK